MCEKLIEAKSLSEDKIKELVKELSNTFTKKEFDSSFLDNICIYTCGSLARYEFVNESDLDLFFINNSNKEISQLYKQLFFQKLFEINKKLKYRDPSKFGLYWDFIAKKNLLDIGSQIEDYNNSFTARLLLILESKPIFNEKMYDNLINDVVNEYFYDYEKHKNDFQPMILLNDIFRYWYTLTLNYEFKRDENDPPNDKYWKRLKLKYPRLLTCFSFISCLFEKNITSDKVIMIIKKTPLERLDYLASNNENLSDSVKKIKLKYNWFLELKSKNESWWNDKENKETAFKNAEEFHNVIFHDLMNEIYNNNMELRNKIDF